MQATKTTYSVVQETINKWTKWVRQGANRTPRVNYGKKAQSHDRNSTKGSNKKTIERKT